MAKQKLSTPPSTKLSWPQASEIVAGLILAGDISPQVVHPEHLSEPYNRIPQLSVELQRLPTSGEYAANIGPLFYGRALQARQAVSTSPANATAWTEALLEAWKTEALAREHTAISDALRAGRPYDPSRLTKIAAANTTSYWQQLSQVSAAQTQYYPTGVSFIDKHVGGLPKSMVILAGDTGSGKTFLAQLMAAGKAGLGENVYIFSREMTAGDIRFRMDQMGVDPARMDRIFVDDRPLDIEDMRAIMLRDSDQPGLIVIDFVDYIAAGNASEAEFARIYACAADMYKDHRCTVLVLAQTSREGTGVMPRKHDLRYSKMAESLGALVWLILNPHTSQYVSSVRALFPEVVRGLKRAYIIQDKARYGAQGHNESLGVIEVTWGDGGKGFLDDGTDEWHDMTIYESAGSSRGNKEQAQAASGHRGVRGPGYVS